MKKSMFILGAAILMLVSCEKKAEGNKAVITKEETTTPEIKPNTSMDLTNTTEEITYPFKAEDGSRAIAKFTNTEKEKTILIRANNHMFQLDRKELTANGAKYERNGVGAEIKGDSLIITQANTQIDLVRVP